MKLLLLALLFCSATASAQRGPFVDPQTQVDIAHPGDVVTLFGGALWKRLRIDKPLTLIGDLNGGTRFEHIDLAGPGTGVLTLERINIDHGYGGLYGELLQGGGFSEVHLIDCYLDANARFDGVPWVELERTTLDPQQGAYYDTPAVSDKGGAIGLFDCNILSSNVMQWMAECDTLYLGGSIQDSGTHYDARAVKDLGSDLHAYGNARLGGTVVLGWAAPGPISELWMSFGTRPPTPAGHGFAFLRSDAQLVALARKYGGIYYQVPFDYALYGTELSFQMFNAPNLYSRPCSVLIR